MRFAVRRALPPMDRLWGFRVVREVRRVESCSSGRCGKAESVGIPFVEVPLPARRGTVRIVERRFPERCRSGPTGAACAASRWTATRTRPGTCSAAACAPSREPQQRAGRRQVLPRLPQPAECRSSKPSGKRSRCKEGSFREQHGRDLVRFLRAGLLQFPHPTTEVQPCNSCSDAGSLSQPACQALLRRSGWPEE